MIMRERRWTLRSQQLMSHSDFRTNLYRLLIHLTNSGWTNEQNDSSIKQNSYLYIIFLFLQKTVSILMKKVSFFSRGSFQCLYYRCFYQVVESCVEMFLQLSEQKQKAGNDPVLLFKYTYTVNNSLYMLLNLNHYYD